MYVFNRFSYVRSAELFAETSRPFEEVALRLSQISALTDSKYGETDIVNVAAGIALTEDYQLVDEKERRGQREAEEENSYSSKSRITTAATSSAFYFHLPSPSVPLKVYLKAKLKQLGEESNDRLVAIITLWLIELLLEEIDQLEAKCGKLNKAADVLEELVNVRNEFRILITSAKFSVG